jgi:hypothetical protein
MRSASFVLLPLFALGCCNHAPEPSTTMSEPEGQPGWFMSPTTSEVAALSPEQAKALLVARAYVEAQATRSQMLKFQVTPASDGNGFEVMVSYMVADGHPHSARLIGMPGGFTVFQVDRNWKIVKIMGGA